METENAIAYYCFNRGCEESVYFSNTIRVTRLPLTAATLSHEQECPNCHSRLISILDIELRQAVYPGKKANVYSSCFSKHIYQ